VGGAEKVRAPREPELIPPPIRASADEAATTSGNASARATVTVFARPRARCVRFMTIFLAVFLAVSLAIFLAIFLKKHFLMFLISGKSP
jgi:hypothetical protein